MSSKRRGLWWIIAVVLMLVLVLAGCQETPPPPPEEQVFKVGVVGPFTGPSAATGSQMRRAAEMAFETVDYQVGDYRIEVLWIDSQSRPEAARVAYETAVAQGLQAGVLNWHSDVAVALMDVTAQHQIPHFFGMGATDLVNLQFQADPARYAYWSFKGWPVGHKMTLNYVSVIEAAITAGVWTPEARRAGIYGEDTDWGHSIGNALKRQLEVAGWEVVEQYVALDTTDFSEVIATFKREGVVLVGGTATADEFFTAFLQEAVAQNFEAVIIADGLNWVGDWYEKMGATTNYVLDQNPGWVTDAGRAFAAAYEARWGDVPSPAIAGLSYDYTRFFLYLLELTLAEYGELTTETFHQFTQARLGSGEVAFTEGIVMPRYQYRPDTLPDMIVEEGAFMFPIVQYMDGHGAVVWPDMWAEAEFNPGY